MLAITNDVDLLKSLATTLIDSVNGYREAADLQCSGSLREMFVARAAEREWVVDRMQRTIRDMGGEVDDDPSFVGQLHQRWLDFKSAVEGKDEDSILDEVAFGESYLQQKFQESIDDESLGGEARRAIEQAYESVCAGNDEIRSIRQARERRAARIEQPSPA